MTTDLNTLIVETLYLFNFNVDKHSNNLLQLQKINMQCQSPSEVTGKRQPIPEVNPHTVDTCATSRTPKLTNTIICTTQFTLPQNIQLSLNENKRKYQAQAAWPLWR